jgi:cytochrome c-type biogenesis protein CcmF
MGEIGRWALIFALVLIPYAITANLLAIRLRSARWRQSAKHAVMALAGLTTLASAALIYLLITGNFEYAYVVNYSSTDMSLFYKITAFWGGNAGSLLLWLWILSIYTALVTWSKHRDSDQYLPWVSSVLLVINLFFAFLLAFVDPPFALNPEDVSEGNGLNPLLQNPSMAVHPVTLYLGYIGFAIPFAYGIAALILKKADATWLTVTRRWTLVSWLFLSMGVIFGAHWAYVELGWGGYWAWDPVENASILPWLTGTAFLHSAMTQERKGMLKRWNFSLVMLTFMLTIFGTFLTRSGLLWSIHAFANGPIGAYFLAFIGMIIVGSLGLMIFRWPVLKAEAKFETAVSKETSFLLNNLLLVGSAFTVFWGTVYPIVSEAVTGKKLMVGAPYFNQVNVPIFIALVILMGICPVIAWKKSSLKSIRDNLLFPIMISLLSTLALYAAGMREWLAILALASAIFVLVTLFLEFFNGVRARVKITGENPFRSFRMLFVKNRRRYGGYIVHLAIIIMVIGLTGAGSYSVDEMHSLKSGEKIEVGKFTLTYRGMGQETLPGRQTTYSELLVKEEGKELGVIRPEKVYYTNGAQPMTEVAVLSSLTEDLYVIPSGWDEETGTAVIQVKIFPLISWVWFGGYVLIFGTMISLWPKKPRRTYTIERESKTELIHHG